MDDDLMTAIKGELVRLESDLSGRLKELDSTDSRPKMDSAVGRLSFMDEMQQHKMAEHGRRNIETQLGRVRSALSRIESGDYGKCGRCGIDIPPERLEYMPEAAYCVQCHDRA